MPLYATVGSLLQSLREAKEQYDQELKSNRIETEDVVAAIAGGREKEIEQDEEDFARVAQAHDAAVVLLRDYLISTSRAEAAAEVQVYADIPPRDYDRRDAAFAHLEEVLQAS